MPRAVRIIPFLCWFCTIIYLSFTPLTDWPKLGMFEKLYADKLVHIVMYAVLCFLLLFGLARPGNQHPWSHELIIYGVVLCAGIGISIEILQPLLTKYRQFEWIDMAANAIGAGIGAFIFTKLVNKSFLRKTILKSPPKA